MKTKGRVLGRAAGERWQCLSSPRVEVASDFDLLINQDGTPFEADVEVQFLRINPPIHSHFKASDVRVYAVAATLDGRRLFTVWGMSCGCKKPQKNTTCKRARLKRGMSGRLRRDLAVAGVYRANETVNFKRAFGGRIFKARVRAVTLDADGDPLPAAARYSRVEKLVDIAAGPVPIPNADPVSPTDTEFGSARAKGSEEVSAKPVAEFNRSSLDRGRGRGSTPSAPPPAMSRTQ